MKPCVRRRVNAMSSSLDYFHRGLSRAFAQQRAKQEQHSKKDLQKVCNDVVDSNVTNTNTIGKHSNVIANTKLTDEQYQTTIIEKMINHIRQKDKTND